MFDLKKFIVTIIILSFLLLLYSTFVLVITEKKSELEVPINVRIRK